jgi:hypothetical protein
VLPHPGLFPLCPWCHLSCCCFGGLLIAKFLFCRTFVAFGTSTLKAVTMLIRV